MAQTGGFTEGFVRKEPLGKVVNESYDGLPNIIGSVAMARTNDPNINRFLSLTLGINQGKHNKKNSPVAVAYTDNNN